MFDDIICKYPLPMPENPQGYTGSENFQTKDLHSVLDTYEIREDGTMWRMDIKCNEWVLCNITQIIEIHDFISTDGEFDYSISYNLNVANGVVQSVELNQFKAINNAAKKENRRLLDESIKARWEFEQTLRYRYIYGPYNRIVRFYFGYACRFNRYLNSNLWKMERKLLI